MRSPSRRVATKLLVACLLLVAAFAQASELRRSSSTSPDARPPVAQPDFHIRGSVTGLFPGVRTRMRLRVRNENPFAIRLSKISTTVQGGTAACPADSLKVTRWAGHKRIPARAVRRVRVEVRMRSWAPQACAGHRYRLAYRGRAVKA